MKKIITIVLLLISNSFLFSQDWKSITYKDILTLNFPNNCVMRDTLGVKVFDGSDSIANYQFIITPADFSGISSVEELNENYEKYLQGMSKTMTGFKLLNKNNVEFNNLHAIRATFQSTTPGQELNIENLSIYLRDTMYCFLVLVPPSYTSNFDEFINEIEFHENMTNSNQFKVASSTGINPEALGQLIGIIVLAVSLFFGLRYSNRRNKTKST